jgi:hypothetical protein
MNVTFHTMASLATAAVLSGRQRALAMPRRFTPSDLPILIIGFTAGVLMHGLLDYVPHAYPVRSAFDVTVSLALFMAALLFVRLRHWLLLGACFGGSIFPDVVDLGPAILNERMGWSLPVVKIFPWHWRVYSGSVYDGSRGFESFLFQMIVATVSLGAIFVCRGQLFRVRGSIYEAAANRTCTRPPQKNAAAGGAQVVGWRSALGRDPAERSQLTRSIAGNQVGSELWQNGTPPNHEK